jgi:hypothetical protein
MWWAQRLSVVLGGAVLGGSVLGVAAPAQAKSWCARELSVHEWGVQVFGANGAPRSGVALPPYFHDQGPMPTQVPAVEGPVWTLPIDSGDRDLPVLQFYGDARGLPIPVAVEVGFTQGEATRWFPQVSMRSPAALSNGAAAAAARDQLLKVREARSPYQLQLAEVSGDPTRQLSWARLALATEPVSARAPAAVPWVDALRAAPDALWVNAGKESERFVFYEAKTAERAALTLERAADPAAEKAGKHHLLIRNGTKWPAFDVFLVHRAGGQAFVFYAPSIPAGATAGLLVEDHLLAAADLGAATRERLRAQLEEGPTAKSAGCVAQRDPGRPTEVADGHQLRAAEVDVLLGVWGARLFDAPGTTLVYREDPRYLDSVMPLSIYTDMAHFITLRRTGLAVVEGLSLP